MNEIWAGNPLPNIAFWWTPDCGALHCETNAYNRMGMVCPDGLTGFGNSDSKDQK